MADIRAFRAFRYDLGRVGALSDVIAPPYDVIDQGLQQTLYDKSPYNVVRLILNREQPDDTETSNRYTRAARFLRDWQHDGILVQDSARSLYVYHQEFESEGHRYTRKGFLARVRLEPFGQGRIYAHEETMPGPKADRLRLFHATAMNLSPIFGLYPDPDDALQHMLDEAIRNTLPLEALDHMGVVSRLWPVSDQQVVSAISGLMGPKPIFIADGHHRYETALRYREEQGGAVRRQQSVVSSPSSVVSSAKAVATDHGLRTTVSGPLAPYDFTLMMLVSMQDPGLVILPTHRLVGRLQNLTGDRLRSLLAECFDLETMSQGEQGARETWELLSADGSQELLGLGTVADGRWQTARFRKPEVMAKLAPEHSAAWRSLAVSVLHGLVLPIVERRAVSAQESGVSSQSSVVSSAKALATDYGLLTTDSAPLPRVSCRFVHLLSEVNEAVASKSCELAVLVPPATMELVEKIAGNLEKMPPKSTYFYPKLLSGLVFNSLKSN